MSKITKKSKFLKYSRNFTLYATAILLVIVGAHLAYDDQMDPDVAQVLWLFEAILMGFYTFACWMLFFLFYPIIHDFVLEKEYLRQKEVKQSLKRSNYVYIALMLIALVLHIIWANMAIINYVIVTVMLLSLFYGMATLATIFSKSKHGQPTRKESEMNLLCLIIFLACAYLCRKFSIDKTRVNPELFSIIIIFYMTIRMNDKVIDENFFEKEL